jgi:ABC-type arginine transport system permease subunit
VGVYPRFHSQKARISIQIKRISCLSLERAVVFAQLMWAEVNSSYTWVQSSHILQSIILGVPTELSILAFYFGGAIVKI